MAKQNRNTASEQTFHKHAFPHESPNQTGYKQLRYEDAATVTADEGVLEYQHFDVSSPSLVTVSATVANSPTNPFTGSYGKMNGQRNVSYRSGANSSYISNGHSQPASSSHLYLDQMTPTTSIPAGGGSRSSGHFAANISASALSHSQSGQKKHLLDGSRLTGAVQASPQSLANESQFVQLQPTGHVSHCSGRPNITACSSWACDGIRENLASLALMCLLSLLMAFLALFFLQRSCPMSLWSEDSWAGSTNSSKLGRPIGAPLLNQRLVSNAKEYMRVFQISVCLSTLTIALNLCCLFVCCIQFLSIVKLIKTPFGKKRSFDFLKRTSHIRVLSFGAFLVSIPIFFTGSTLPVGDSHSHSISPLQELFSTHSSTLTKCRLSSLLSSSELASSFAVSVLYRPYTYGRLVLFDIF